MYVSMDGEEMNKFDGHESALAGAIFMSSRATKKECIKRKLFGLPSSMSHFIKQIKVGTLLFLFEHEERKLYGVFEATCDGAMNIMPDAYLASGKPFPAQVRVKRLWISKPLSEDEFSGAIKNNYYAPYKFSYGLSCDQVFKLLQLFSLKRINVDQHQRPDITNEIFKGFEKHGWNSNKVSVSKRGGPTEIFSDNGGDPQRHIGFSESNVNGSMYKKLTRKQRSFVSTGLYQTALRAIEAQVHCSVHANSSTSGKACSPLTHEHATHIGSSFDINPWPFRSQVHTSHSDPSLKHLSSPNPTRSSSPFCNALNVNGQRIEFKRYDPSNPRISISPEIFEAKPTNSFPSFHPSNSHGDPEASRHESDSRRKSIDTITSDSYSSEFIEDVDSQRVRPNLQMHSEVHPTIVESKHHSDTKQSRTSVFSRLTKSSEHRQLLKTPKESKRHSDTKQNRTSVFSRLTKPSELHHMSKTLKDCRSSKSQKAFQDNEAKQVRHARVSFQRREQLMKITVDRDIKNFDSVGEVVANKVTSPGELVSSNDMIEEGEIRIDEEDNNKHLLLNFNSDSNSHCNTVNLNGQSAQTELYDTSSPMILISPEMHKAKHTKSFPSVYPITSHGDSEAPRHESDSREKSIDKNTSDDYSLESTEDDDSKGIKPNLKTHFEVCPTTVESWLSSDSEQSRPSVFSRLTKPSKTCQLSNSQKAVQKNEAGKRILSFSQVEHTRKLFQRREQLIKMVIVAETEPNKLASPGELESSNDEIEEGRLDEEEKSDHLSLNLKRKREILRSSVENVIDVETLKQHERRKLLKPFYSGEEYRSVQPLAQEFDGVEPVGENSEDNIENGEISHLLRVDTDNKNISVSEVSLCDIMFDESDKKPEATVCDVASDKSDKNSESLMNSEVDAENKNWFASEASASDLVSDETEKSAESLSGRRKEISTRNLLWFMQKSVNVGA